MKSQFNNLVKKFNSYYEPGKIDEVQEEKKDTFLTHKNCKQLKRENDKLKLEFSSNVLNKFKTRRSIRKYSDKDVDWKKIYNIIEAGINAPVAGNIQNYDILVISKAEDKKELGKLAFQQYWLADAPYLLVIIRDNRRLMQLYPNEGEIYAVQNSAALIENILMMAHIYDLGACWVEAYDNQVLKEFLDVPIEYKIDAIIPIGYPLENPNISKDPTTTKIYFDKFGKREKK